MFELIIFIVAIGALIYYVLGLDFELGTGFTEMRKKIREGKYEVVDSKDAEKKSKNKLLK